MATSGSARDAYSGRPQFFLRVAVSRDSVDAANNRTRWDYSLRVDNDAGTNLTYHLDPVTYEISVEGVKVASGNVPSGTFDFRDGDDYHNIKTGTTGWYTHDSNGNLTLNFSGKTGSAGIFGSASAAGSIAVDRIPAAPGAPGKPTVVNITPTGAKISWTAASRGHANIDDYDLDISLNSSFSPEGDRNPGNALTMTVDDLTPGTTYYTRARAHNADGWGPYSAVTSFTTLPASPPTLNSVTPDATGKTATLSISLPAGMASVTSYNIWRRTPGGTWAIVASGSANPSQTVSGLTPGATYEWKVTALIGTYETPDSNVISKTQPQPNTSPGAYFDGNTTDTPQTDYAWASTAGASVSTASTKTGAAVGWLTGAQAVAAPVSPSGGQAVQYQVPGSLEPDGNGGAYSVAYAVSVAATANGFRGGTNGTQGFADVTVGGRYMGSIWVESNRERTLAAMWVWYNAGGAEIGTSLGDPVAVLKDTPTRLRVLGTAPAGAVKGAVVFTDPPGSSMMQPSDQIIADADMASSGTLYPYFDGDTADTAAHLYGWVAAQYTSASTRTDIPQSEQDPLQDPNCDPIPKPPQPPILEDDCIEPVGSWRRLWYEVPSAAVPAWLSAVPGITLHTFSEAEQQVRIRWYANPDGVPPLDFDASTWDYEQIISYIPPCTDMTLDGVSQRVWAVVGTWNGTTCVPGTGAIPADHLLYGTGGVPATWPVLSCGTSWLISLDTPLTADPNNLTIDADLTVRE